MQQVKIPIAKNLRADEMWAIIEPSADFEGKKVLDLGCGHGDMLGHAWCAGASVLGIDNNEEQCHSLRESIDASIDNFSIIQSDINYLGDYYRWGDIIFCFSVLPYLHDPNTVLKWIREYSDMTFIEVQYAGDGPGFPHIRNDDDMQKWLSRIGWQNIEAIGRTHTRIRPAWRTIWKCS